MHSNRFSRGFWLVLVAALVSASVTASLGFWQLRRAALKEQIQADIQLKASAETLNNADVKAVDTLVSWLHRGAAFSGTWVPDATVFLDNRQMGGRQGFYVVTPFRLAQDGRWVLVQRGWTPRDFLDRTRVPQVPTPTGVITLSGRIAASPGKVYELGQADAGPVRQNLDVTAFAREHAAQILGGSLVQLAPVPDTPSDGLLRNWPQVASDVHKHHGYAFQWFGLCALILILYVWFQIISPLRRTRTADPLP
jgi:surfeit locus 1 family protein